MNSLLRHAADVARTDSAGQTCLHQASAKCTVALLEASCGVNSRDSGGTTALFNAAEAGCLERVRLLVGHGAEVNIADKTGWTCLFWAAREGRTEVCSLLVELGAEPSHKDLAGRTARTAAAVYGKGPTAALLEGIERRRANRGAAAAVGGPGGGASAAAAHAAKAQPSLIDRLYHAVHTETPSHVQACINEGVDPSLIIIPRGQTLVFVAAARPKGACEVCALLVRQRMDPTVVDTQFRQTALFFAVRNSERAGGLECTRFLLQARCNPDHVDMHGQTPLFYAVQRSDPSCAEALLECSVDLARRDVRGQTATFFAAKEGAEDSLRALLAARASTNACDSVGQTPLFYASRPAVVEALLAHRCDADKHDNAGMTALMVLAGHGFDDSVRHLATKGGVHAEDSSGQPCLFYAAKAGSVKTIRILVECGADVLHTSHKKSTAADVAALNGKQAAMTVLSELTTEALRTRPAPLKSNGSRKRGPELLNSAGASEVLSSASSMSAVAPGSLPGKAARREYVFVFDDPRVPGRTIPFGTPEYAIALQRLTNKCPWLDKWDKLAPMYSPTKPGRTLPE